ncbi:MAG: 4Fe-4S double cluster binding domain-containing protein [Christensenellales bacterium]
MSGFAEERVISLSPFPRWKALTEANPDKRYGGLCAEPAQIAGNAKGLKLLVWPYAPYADVRELPFVSAYYEASNAAYSEARKLGEVCDNIPLKPALLRAGLGRYGRNALILHETYGSRFVVQCILSRESPQFPDAEESDALSDFCASCDLCIRACPVGAISTGGKVDLTKCLRAFDEALPVPEDKRHLLGKKLLGCDICMDACPRNRQIGRVQMPIGFAKALSLEEILHGNVAPLGEIIGRNFARARRLQARACIVAANMGRRDLLPIIEGHISSDFPALAVHAKWAKDILKI